MSEQVEENHNARCSCCGRHFLSACEVLDDLCPECRRYLQSPPADGEAAPPALSGKGTSSKPFFRYRPGALEIIILANLLIFALMGFPDRSTAEDTFIHWGAEWGPLTFGAQWWRMFTSMFVHLNREHIVANMICLILAGRPVKRVFATPTLLAVYALSGLAGELASLQFQPELTSMGASGAIFGVVGLLIAVTLTGNLPESVLRRKTRFWFFALLLASTIATGITDPDPAIDTAAHLGGFVAGLAMGLLLIRILKQPFSTADFRSQTPIFAGMAVLLLAGTLYLRHEYAYLKPLATARSAMSAGQLQDAARDLKTVLAGHPNDILANRDLGMVLFQQGNYPAAESALNRSMETNGNNLYSESQLCQVYIHEAKFAEAEAMLHKLRQHGYYGHEERILAADLLFAEGKYAEAGEKYYIAHDYDKAIAAMQKHLATKPDDRDTLEMMRDAYQANKMSDAAEQTQKRINALQDDQPVLP